MNKPMNKFMSAINGMIMQKWTVQTTTTIADVPIVINHLQFLPLSQMVYNWNCLLRFRRM